jgi:transcriptional regulator with XRE-family HTH domain
MPRPKLRQQREARRLREELGLSIKDIAARLDVSVASAHAWTRGIVLTPDQRKRIDAAASDRRSVAWVEYNRERRRRFQAAGREQAREGEQLHQAGCMLYWAEGWKSRGGLAFCNADRAMVGLFWRFLDSYFEFDHERVRVRLNVYLNNGLTLDEIESWWNEALGLPSTCFRNHVINHFPTSSSGRRQGRLPHGVCTIRLSSTAIVQHIFGAIQEYAGFDEPRWLDGPSRRRP